MTFVNANDVDEGLYASKPCPENVKCIRQRVVRLLSRKKLGDFRHALIPLSDAKYLEHDTTIGIYICRFCWLCRLSWLW